MNQEAMLIGETAGVQVEQKKLNSRHRAHESKHQWRMGVGKNTGNMHAKKSSQAILEISMAANCTCNNQIVFCDNSLKGFHQSVSS